MDKRYLAGFFDGEGCLSISKGTRWRNGKIEYAPHAAAFQNTKAPLLLFKKAFGGCIHPHRNGWSWSLTGFKRVSKVIAVLEKHLIVKRGAVRIMKEFLATIGEQRDRAGVPARIMAKRARLHRRLHALQGYGN